MSAPTSEIDICNLALDELSQGPVTSITDPQTKAEDLCARHYDQTRRTILRKYNFNFSTKLKVLTKSGIKTPAFGFLNAYKLPNDFIRFRALGDISINADTPRRLYRLQEGFIFTSTALGNGDTIQTEYIFNAIDISKFDPLFIDVLVLSLARKLAYPLTQKRSLVKDIGADLIDAQAAAAAVDGQEDPPRRIERSRLRDVRRRGGGIRDNTRV